VLTETTGSGKFLFIKDPTLLDCPRSPSDEAMNSDNRIWFDADPNVFFSSENDTLLLGTTASLGLLTNILDYNKNPLKMLAKK